jgi:hypothetical protein
MIAAVQVAGPKAYGHPHGEAASPGARAEPYRHHLVYGDKGCHQIGIVSC